MSYPAPPPPGGAGRQHYLTAITKVDDRGKLSLEPVLEEPADQEGRDAASEGPGDAPAEG